MPAHRVVGGQDIRDGGHVRVDLSLVVRGESLVRAKYDDAVIPRELADIDLGKLCGEDRPRLDIVQAGAQHVASQR